MEDVLSRPFYFFRLQHYTLSKGYSSGNIIMFYNFTALKKQQKYLDTSDIWVTFAAK
jgi:hypothetical protein